MTEPIHISATLAPLKRTQKTKDGKTFVFFSCRCAIVTLVRRIVYEQLAAAHGTVPHTRPLRNFGMCQGLALAP